MKYQATRTVKKQGIEPLQIVEFVSVGVLLLCFVYKLLNAENSSEITPY